MTAASSRRAGSRRRPRHADDGPRTFVSASAIGYYGFDRGDALLCEESVRGDGFLADVVSRLGGGDGAGRGGGAAGGHRAHGNRAIGARRHAEADAPAVRGRAGRQARRRRAVVVVDRARRPARRVPPRPLRHSVDRSQSTPSRPSRCATPTTPGRSPGCCTVRRWCRCRRWVRGCCWGSRAHANSPRRISGWFRPSCRRWGTASGGQRSRTRWLTNWGMADGPRASGNREPSRGSSLPRRRRVLLCEHVIRRD